VTEAGQWRLDTWLFQTSATGQLKKALFNTVMAATGAAAGDGTTTAFDLVDPATRTRFDTMLKYWAKR
jgi:hypothetical protein